jgi:hypothetical protein
MTRSLPRAAAALLLATVALAACRGGSDGAAERPSTTTTAPAAPRTPSFAVADLAPVDQCQLLSVAEAGSLLHRPAALTRQETMGNMGTCTVQATGSPLAIVQWNVGVPKVSASTYTRWLAGLEDDLREGAAPGTCQPFDRQRLPAAGLGDGATLLSCGGPARATYELAASTGGHELLLTVTRAPDPAGAHDVVDAAQLLVSRLPR